MILENAQWVLFAWVFGNQVGVPVTVVPVLLGAGALARSGRLSLVVILPITVVASLGADLTWYVLGWWRGPRLLNMLGQASPRAATSVRRARQAFVTHVGAFQLSARFLPELNPIAAGLAGATGSSLSRFLCRGTVSALVWALAWIGCGYFLSEAITEIAARLGVYLIVMFLVPFALYLALHHARRHVIRGFRGVARLRGTMRPLSVGCQSVGKPLAH